jgi:hypothetical protein
LQCTDFPERSDGSCLGLEPRADPDVFAQSAKTTEVFALAHGRRQLLQRRSREEAKACSKRSPRERSNTACGTEGERQVFVREAKNAESLLPTSYAQASGVSPGRNTGCQTSVQNETRLLRATREAQRKPWA